MILEKILNKIKKERHESKLLELWKIKNKDNYTVPGSIGIISLKYVEIGKRTYGKINLMAEHTTDNLLKIGSYCSIASGVYFLLGAEHNILSLSTYPFKTRLYGTKKEALSKGNIVLFSAM